MLIAITGTPGVGKSAASAELRSRGYEVVDLKAHIISHGLMGRLDEGRDTREVDLDLLNDSLEEYREGGGTAFMEGHLSHYMDCGRIIVLRCSPDTVAERLRARGYGEPKVLENVRSEVLDVILCESVDTDIPVAEIDCTGHSVAEVADMIEQAAFGGEFPPGKVDWSQELEKWFLTDREREQISLWPRWPRS